MISQIITGRLNIQSLSEEDVDDLVYQIYVFRASKASDTKSLVEIFLQHQRHLGQVSRLTTAKSLNMSSRTLSRRLENKNTSFKQLLNNERKRRCYHYLQNEIDNGADISQLLGFSSPTYFYQAFKQWTQLSFTEAKKKLANNQRDIGNLVGVQLSDTKL